MRCAILCALPAVGAVGSGPVVETAYGPVRGLRDPGRRGADAWWGVPYAAPPVGALRFAPPRPPAPWIDPLATTREPPMCPQADVGRGLMLGEEDCLYLNVFTPSDRAEGERLPVLYWIHGGGFAEGNGESGPLPKSLAVYDGRHLAASQRAVVVSINYRLNNLGFLALQELLDEHGTAGNWAILDQQLGLRWVRDNIAGFGGDPGRVTIFGESAGGVSVTAHTAMPSSKGLFHAAIAESSLPGGQFFYPLDRAMKWGDMYAAAAGCNVTTGRVACLRALPLKKAMVPLLNYLSKDWPGLAGFNGPNDLPPLWPLMPWVATIDGTTIPRGPLEPGCEFNAVPIIAGTNHDEGTLFGSPIVDLIPKMLGVRKDVVHLVMKHMLNATVVPEMMREYAVAEHPEQAFVQFFRDYMFTCPTRAWLRAVNRQKVAAGRPVDTWQYMFNWTMDDGFGYKLLGDFHSSEMPYVFGNPFARHIFGIRLGRWTKKDKELSNSFGSYWAQLARAGDPNDSPKCDGCVEWPAYRAAAGRAVAAGDEPVMVFDVPLAVSNATAGDWGKGPAPRCDFWDRWGYTQPYGHF